MNKAIKKGVAECKNAAGINPNAPIANNNRPKIIPFRYPYRFMKAPAGSAIKK